MFSRLLLSMKKKKQETKISKSIGLIVRLNKGILFQLEPFLIFISLSLHLV